MNSSERAQFVEQVRELFTSQRVGVLATRFEHAPHQSLIAYVASDDLTEIIFVTPQYTRKVAAIDQDAHVALLVDDRQNLELDFDACVAVTARGSAERIAQPQSHRCFAMYLERHPYLESFAASPSCSFYRILVRSYSMASRFQNVDEIVL